MSCSLITDINIDNELPKTRICGDYLGKSRASFLYPRELIKHIKTKTV